jgi:hypothetical protein
MNRTKLSDIVMMTGALYYPYSGRSRPKHIRLFSTWSVTDLTEKYRIVVGVAVLLWWVSCRGQTGRRCIGRCRHWLSLQTDDVARMVTVLSLVIVGVNVYWR